MNDSEPLNLECPRCHLRLCVPTDKAGQMIWCPDCDAAIEVPGEVRIAQEPRRRSHDPWPRYPREDDGYPEEGTPRRRGSRAAGKVTPPAICMIVVAALGLLLNLLGVVQALGELNPVDPQAPPFVQEIMRNAQGPITAMVQGGCALLSTLTILGSVQMLRLKSWGLGMTAAIITMVNFGNFCCVLGMPIGIWALVVLQDADVTDAYS